MNKAIVFGAGNIGRGFIGQLFSQSGYEVVFVDIDKSLVEVLNREGKYPISIVSDDKTEEIIVGPVRGIDGNNQDSLKEEMKDALIMATAVGGKALKSVSISIAKGLKKRWQIRNFEPVNIIICENMLNADEYMKKIILSRLDRDERDFFDKYVGLVEASIGRMVPVVDRHHDPLRIYVEEYDELPVDREGFKGQIPKIKNMIPYSPFSYYIHRKLFVHNMGHAIAAYLGRLKNYKYIWEAMEDPVIATITIGAMEESAWAISKEHGVPYVEVMDHAEDLLNRFKNRALGDTIARVGKDPIRKLSGSDRLGGAATLCSAHEILPQYITLGIGAALLFYNPGDEESVGIQAYIKENGIERAITNFTSIAYGDDSFKMILNHYNSLKKGTGLDNIVNTIEVGKRFEGGCDYVPGNSFSG